MTGSRNLEIGSWKGKVKAASLITYGSNLLAIENVYPKVTNSMAWERRNWRKSSWVESLLEFVLLVSCDFMFRLLSP